MRNAWRAGPELLADTLVERGADVRYAEVHRRVQPKADMSELLRQWTRGEIQAVVVTSNEGLRNLFDIVGKLGQQWLRNSRLVVMSERATALAQDLGLKRPAVGTGGERRGDCRGAARMTGRPTATMAEPFANAELHSPSGAAV